MDLLPGSNGSNYRCKEFLHQMGQLPESNESNSEGKDFLNQMN